MGMLKLSPNYNGVSTVCSEMPSDAQNVNPRARPTCFAAPTRTRVDTNSGILGHVRAHCGDILYDLGSAMKKQERKTVVVSPRSIPFVFRARHRAGRDHHIHSGFVLYIRFTKVLLFLSSLLRQQ